MKKIKPTNRFYKEPLVVVICGEVIFGGSESVASRRSGVDELNEAG